MEIIIREIETKLNVFDVYSLFNHAHDLILLESSRDNERIGRYSFIGLYPFKKVTYTGGRTYEDDIEIAVEPFGHIQNLLEKYSIQNNSELPFVGGAMGYIGYDMMEDIEKVPIQSESIQDIPDMYFLFYDNVIVFDHRAEQVFITQLCRSSITSQLNAIEKTIAQGKPVTYGTFKREPIDFQSPFTKKEYIQSIESMRRYIRTGDIYIANMTHTYSAQVNRQGYDIYKVLRKINSAPFGAFLPLDGFEVICSSPERFLKLRNGWVETRPIKGTRPRGADEKQDALMRQALIDSEKDKAELLMIVDLERNDLSKVCRAHSVKVTELFEIESYATVHHLVATVVGQLEDDKSAVDLMKACFPGGSITGTPKKRALEVIDSLEKNKRHLYTGCIGYFGFDGGCDFNIVIRTIVKKGNQLTLGVGGGITWESNSEEEYQETLDKAGVLFDAISYVEVDQ